MPPPQLYVFVSLVALNGKRVSNTCNYVSSFVNAALLCYLNFLKHAFSAYCVTMVWSMWLYNLSTFTFILSDLCLGGCAFCYKFYSLGWLLVWSPVFWYCLGSHHSVIMLLFISLQLCFPCHWCTHHQYLLWLCLVCLLMLILFTQLRYKLHHYNSYHRHCTHLNHQVTDWYGS